MYDVYVLQSKDDESSFYTGFTADLRRRFLSHNDGNNPSTRHGRPWRVLAYLVFADKAMAHAFERYLKSGSGKTFAKRHFRPKSG